MSAPSVHSQTRLARDTEPSAADRRHILICDDDAELALILAEHLRSCGHVVELSASADQALQRIASDAGSSVDVVITDLGMLDANGAELLHLLQVGHPSTHVILMTADALIHEQTLAGCGCPVLGKPCRLDDIEQLIRSRQPHPIQSRPPTFNASLRRNTP